jgi:hypothetical protein
LSDMALEGVAGVGSGIGCLRKVPSAAHGRAMGYHKHTWPAPSDWQGLQNPRGYEPRVYGGTGTGRQSLTLQKPVPPWRVDGLCTRLCLFVAAARQAPQVLAAALFDPSTSPPLPHDGHASYAGTPGAGCRTRRPHPRHVVYLTAVTSCAGTAGAAPQPRTLFSPARLRVLVFQGRYFILCLFAQEPISYLYAPLVVRLDCGSYTPATPSFPRRPPRVPTVATSTSTIPTCVARRGCGHRHDDDTDACGPCRRRRYHHYHHHLHHHHHNADMH